MPFIAAEFLPDAGYYPIIIFAALILSGINFPFSEDIIIIAAALAAKARPDLIVPLYISIFVGVIISDHIAYWIGFKLGTGLIDSKFFPGVFSQKKITIIQKYLHNHGILTFIVCRFIPFGIRNTLFMSSGFSKMNYKNFTFYDLLAVSINTSTLFFLVYFLGISVEKPIRTIGMVLFIVLVITLLITIYKLYYIWRNKQIVK